MANVSFHDSGQICQGKDDIIKSSGIFFGESLLLSSTPILFVQLSLAALCTASFQLFLNPLGESAFFSQMLVIFLFSFSFFNCFCYI